jgi:NTP pyrophosphatase (non-canonical NTP hydrolase)
MKLVAALAIFLLCASSASIAQSLDQVDQLAHANKALDLLHQLQAMSDEQAHATKFSCLKAFGNDAFCKCLSGNLPMRISFADYVSIVTQTKEQKGYGKLSDDVKKAYDMVPAVREKMCPAWLGYTLTIRSRRTAPPPLDSSVRRHDMNFDDLEKSALALNELYEQLEAKKYGRVWTTEELALGFVGDVGDLAKLIQAHAGVRSIDDRQSKLGHELSDCLWSIIVLANKCGIDLEAEFVKNNREIAEYISGELGKPQASP